jgi:hypothetical protein
MSGRLIALPLVLLAAPASASQISTCQEARMPAVQQIAQVVQSIPVTPPVKPPLKPSAWATKVAEAFEAMTKQPLAVGPPSSVIAFAGADAPNKRGPFQLEVDGKKGFGVFDRAEGLGGTWYIFDAHGTLAGKVPGKVSQDDLDGLHGRGTVPPFLGTGDGTAVTLAGIDGTTIPLSPKLTAMLGATPSGWPLTAAAFQLPKAKLAAALAQDSTRTELLNAAFAAWLDGRGNPFAIGATRPITSVAVADVPGTYYHMLADDIGGDWEPGDRALNQKNMQLLGKSLVAGGVTGVYEVHYDNSDDTDYTALVSVNTLNGQVRVLGYRDDP